MYENQLEERRLNMLQHVINYSHREISLGNNVIVPAYGSIDADVKMTADINQLIQMGIIKLTNVIDNSIRDVSKLPSAKDKAAARMARMQQIRLKAGTAVAGNKDTKKVAAKGSSTSKGK